MNIRRTLTDTIPKAMRPDFRFPSYTNLKTDLGEIDACAECQEIAVRDFVEKCKDGPDTVATIQERSQHHGIKVDTVDLDRFARRNTELQLVSVTQAFEAFLNHFIAEHPRLGSREGRQDKQTLLDFIIEKAVPKGAANTLRSSIEYRVYNYYRSLRNDVAHGTDREPKKLAALLAGLQQDAKANPEYQRLDAPHALEALAFDDYVLFTRTAKNLASLLCDAGALTDDEVLSWASNHLPTRGTPERKANALRAALGIRFNLAKNRADVTIASLLPLEGQ